MRDKWREYETMREEQCKCVKLCSVWVIMKDGKKLGVIKSRRAANGTSSLVTVKMRPKANIANQFIYGSERVRGLDSKECALEGIAKILIRNRRKLKKHYGLDIPNDVEVVSERWRDYFHENGYTVIGVI